MMCYKPEKPERSCYKNSIHPTYNSECQAANQNASFVGRKPIHHGSTFLNRTTLLWLTLHQKEVKSRLN